MKKVIFTLLLFACMATSVLRPLAQGVAVNETGNSPDPSAALDVSSTTQGVLISRMSTAERDAISNPALGLLIYNTTTDCINMRLINSWKEMCGECSFPLPGLSYNSPLCAGQTLYLTATTSLSGATYSWTGPDGFSSSDQNPTIQNVTSDKAGVYSLTVTKDGCTSSAATINVVLATAPGTPASITGPAGICSSNTYNMVYTAEEVAGANYYSWTVPADATLVSGQGTSSIVVNFGSGSGDISVAATNTSNTCGWSSPATFSVLFSYSQPSDVGTISGPSGFSIPQTGYTYSVDPVYDAAEYVWSVPTGATITSGQGTNSITVDFSCTALSGAINVYASNGCGISNNTSTFDVVITSPFTGATYLSSSCLSSATYTFALASTTPYNWTVPSGATITSGQGTNEITVNYSGNVVDDAICVSFTNASCSSSSVCNNVGVDQKTFVYSGGYEIFTVPSCVSSITVDAYGAQGGAPVESTGGLGGRVQATLDVTPGEQLYIFIGSQATNSIGGFNGGGAGGGVGMGGGGASDIRRGGTTFYDRIVVAGGGGGTSSPGRPGQTGGSGGGLTGGNGSNPYPPQYVMYGSGGTQTSGGAGESQYHYNSNEDGTFGLGGHGGTANMDGGGGGGGYYGGGGGDALAGGGGSGYVTPSGSSGVSQTNGQRTGNGTIIITW